MEKFKPEFGNKAHIDLIRKDEQRLEKEEMMEHLLDKFPDDFVTREEYDILKKKFEESLLKYREKARELEELSSVINFKIINLLDKTYRDVSDFNEIYP